ncbi:MAG: hypothetical protein ACOCUH_04190, partial [Bacteriovoracia bacterium]
SRSYLAMDYWRVKSLYNILQIKEASQFISEVKIMIQEKGKILLKGYRKHNNWDNYQEINSIVTETSLD